MPAEGAECQGGKGSNKPRSLPELRTPPFRSYCQRICNESGRQHFARGFGDALKRVRSFMMDLFANNNLHVLRLLMQAEGTVDFQRYFTPVTNRVKSERSYSPGSNDTLDIAAYGFIREEYRKYYSGYSDEELCRFLGVIPSEMADKLRDFGRSFPKRFQKK